MKKQAKAKRGAKSALPGRIEAALWIVGAVWIVLLLFYVMVTERYFADPLAGLLLFVPFSMLVAAGLLHSWRKNWPHRKVEFYAWAVVWTMAWVSLLVKTFR